MSDHTLSGPLMFTKMYAYMLRRSSQRNNFSDGGLTELRNNRQWVVEENQVVVVSEKVIFFWFCEDPVQATHGFEHSVRFHLLRRQSHLCLFRTTRKGKQTQHGLVHPVIS